jgi:hypothetical protein
MLLLVGAVLAGSIAVAFGAARVGVPSLVAFLALGMLAGSSSTTQNLRERSALSGSPRSSTKAGSRRRGGGYAPSQSPPRC